MQMLTVVDIRAVSWQQVDTHTAGEPRWQCTHNDGHLLFTSVIQRDWDQVNSSVWSKVRQACIIYHRWWMPVWRYARPGKCTTGDV